MNARIWLSALSLSLSLPVLAPAQGNFQDAGSQPAYEDPAPTPATAPAPVKTEEQVEEEDRVLRIEAQRERRLRNARAPGTGNRMDPMRAFPGELPIKTNRSFVMDLEGRSVEDASRAQVLPTYPQGHAVPDPID